MADTLAIHTVENPVDNVRAKCREVAPGTGTVGKRG